MYINSHALNAECGHSSGHKASLGALMYWHMFPKGNLHVHLYFNYYQLFSITLNRFLFSKANYFRYFPQEKFILHWLQRYSHCLGRILGPLGLLAPVELYRVLQTQMGLQFQVQWLYWDTVTFSEFILFSSGIWTEIN